MITQPQPCPFCGRVYKTIRGMAAHFEQHPDHKQRSVCTCTDPAVACPACLSKRDRHGFPMDWRNRMAVR